MGLDKLISPLTSSFEDLLQLLDSWGLQPGDQLVVVFVAGSAPLGIILGAVYNLVKELKTAPPIAPSAVPPNKAACNGDLRRAA